jgi:hypothetical protein
VKVPDVVGDDACAAVAHPAPDFDDRHVFSLNRIQQPDKHFGVVFAYTWINTVFPLGGIAEEIELFSQ